MFPAKRLARIFAVLNSRIFYKKARILLSIVAIALGVALGFAVHLINRAAVNELAAGVRTLAGEADLEVRGGRAGFPEALYARLSRLPGVAVASPVLEVEAGIPGSERTIRLIGIDSLRAGLIQPALFADEPGRRLELMKPDVVFLSFGGKELLGEKQHLEIISGLNTIQLQIGGTMPSSSLRGVAALTDI
ncbi:MAG: ABC transporter permease, partial [Pseudomonadota bacterium]